jgi:outer membrane lipoprotein-sorting protein
MQKIVKRKAKGVKALLLFLRAGAPVYHWGEGPRMLPFLPAPPPALQAQPRQQALPAWWGRWTQAPAFECRFEQEAESAAFGKLARAGSILAARGGRLRVEYDKGPLLVSDGRLLTQYDPATRTAQSFEMEAVADEWPMLRLLMDPRELDGAFDVKSMGGGRVSLSPRRPGLPDVALDGSGGFPGRIEWRDATGAAQVLTLKGPRAVPAPKAARFAFDPPRGTKWVK